MITHRGRSDGATEEKRKRNSPPIARFNSTSAAAEIPLALTVQLTGRRAYLIRLAPPPIHWLPNTKNQSGSCHSFRLFLSWYSGALTALNSLKDPVLPEEPNPRRLKGQSKLHYSPSSHHRRHRRRRLSPLNLWRADRNLDTDRSRNALARSWLTSSHVVAIECGAPPRLKGVRVAAPVYIGVSF